MKEIDWSKAPQWATHYGPDSDCYCESWYQVIDGKIVAFSEADSAVCVRQQANQGECFYHPIEDLIARWTGEGLPPVGTVCEAWHNGCAQGVVQVRYSGGCMVLWNVKLKHEQCSASENYTFNPIRTPEQIAAEEREKAIDAIQDDLSLSPECRYIAKRVYESGYRKVTP